VSRELTVNRLAAAMVDMPQLDIPAVHHFGPGIYMREVTIPAGSLVIGHHHRHPHLCILMQGTLRLLDGSGEWRTITAPLIFTAPAGRKVGLAVEGDVVFQNVFATDETDVEKIEDEIVDKAVFVDGIAEIRALEAAI
jgi:quercetin dioxygenase-like cupin family protein